MPGDREANTTAADEADRDTTRHRSWLEDWVEGRLATLFGDRFLYDYPHPTAHDAQARSARARQQSNSPLTARLVPYSNPPPSMADAGLRFCVEDTVGLKHDKLMVGMVDRSFGDVDSHEPRPQDDYNEDIVRHKDIPKEQFQKFMKTGIPPRGTVLVSWQTVFKAELIPEAKLELLDRALLVGDVVKRNAKDPMSGTVIGARTTSTLFPATAFYADPIPQALNKDLSIREVPDTELLSVHEYVEGAVVVYNDWVGRVEEIVDQVAIKLANNSVVVVENAEELLPDDPLIERLSVGDTVKTKKLNLRRGRWIFGLYDPNVKPHGTVVETRTKEVNVQWLTRRLATDTSRSPHSGSEPPSVLEKDDLESPHFYGYNATGGAAITLPLLTNGVDRLFEAAQVSVGDRVRFKDLSGATVKYDGTRTLPNGYPQGKLARLPRTETLGYDMNVYIVMQTHSKVMVQWQDLTITEESSPFLIPDPNVEDDDEVWPGEIVCTKEQKNHKAKEQTSLFIPAKVGVVQAVKPRDRIATVRWFENPNVGFWDEDLIPPAETGKLLDDAEDVSLYDIRSMPSISRRRGDWVIIYDDSPLATIGNDVTSIISGPTWFGEVVDLGLDGKVTVRLGAAKPVVDVHIPAERVTLVYSSDMDPSQFDLSQLEGLDSAEDIDDDGSEADPDDFNEMWIEYEGMEPTGNYDDEDWSTEDDDDSSMPDLESVDDVDTSKTTPETHSDAEPRSPTTAEPPTTKNTNSAEPRSGSPMAENPLISIPEIFESTTPSGANVPEPLLILETPPPLNHRYVNTPLAAGFSSSLLKRIAKEHKILRSSLPSGIFVRTWESRLDLIRVLMIGPSDTPYEYAPFMIDIQLSSLYPSKAPDAYFHSWTNGNGPVNPNLYEDGKICLSLLGTWHADERNESWSPSKSTLLQVLVSIMGLVLVKEPYYNEAGYDIHREAPETKLNSALYTERAYFRARAFIVHALSNNVAPFSEELKYLYTSKKEGAPQLLDKAVVAAKEILERSSKDDQEDRDGLTRISLGAVVMLKRQVDKLEELRARLA